MPDRLAGAAFGGAVGSPFAAAAVAASEPMAEDDGDGVSDGLPPDRAAECVLGRADVVDGGFGLVEPPLAERGCDVVPGPVGAFTGGSDVRCTGGGGAGFEWTGTETGSWPPHNAA
jgi:hypothetical protein